MLYYLILFCCCRESDLVPFCPLSTPFSKHYTSRKSPPHAIYSSSALHLNIINLFSLFYQTTTISLLFFFSDTPFIFATIFLVLNTLSSSSEQCELPCCCDDRPGRPLAGYYASTQEGIPNWMKFDSREARISDFDLRNLTCRRRQNPQLSPRGSCP